MSITRRDLLAAATGALATWGVSRIAPLGHSQSHNTQFKNTLPYSIYGLGMEGQRFPGGQIHRNHEESVLTELNLNSGLITQTLLPMPNGHFVTCLSNDLLVCTPIQGPQVFVLNKKHKTEIILDCDSDSIFGGHGIHLPKEKLFLASVKSKNPKMSGYLAAYDDQTFELVNKIDIHAYYPHDLQIMPNAPHHIIVSHGSQAQSFHNKYLGRDPIVSIIDATTGNIIKRHTDFELQGLNHVAVTQDGDIYTSQLTSISPTEESRQKLDTDFPQKKWAWGDGTGSKLDRLPYPAPILSFPHNAKPQEYMSDPGLFLRHQDITYHKFLNQIYSTYSESNTIAILKTMGDLEVLDAGLFGIYKVRGIRALPQTSLVLINDSENGFALIDMKEKKLVRSYRSHLFLTRHLTIGHG